MTWLKPEALIFSGVAGGLKSDTALGDVVVATQIVAYHGGKQDRDAFKARPQAWHMSHRLLEVARYVATTDQWRTYLEGSGDVPTVHFKAIAAGEVVLNSSDSELALLLENSHNDVAAIEMEAAGIASAMQLSGAVPSLVIRGISDFADGNKASSDAAGWQQTAARNAAALTTAVIADLQAQTAPQGGGGQNTVEGDTPSSRSHIEAIGVSASPWSVLPKPLDVRWRADLLRSRGAESAVFEVHLVPVDTSARLEVTRLHQLKDELVQFGRQNQAFEAAKAVDNSASDKEAIACITDYRSDRTGFAVCRNGQRSSWEALPRIDVAAVFDPEHLAARLEVMIKRLLALDVPLPAAFAPAVGLEPTISITEGKVGQPHGRAVTISMRQTPARVEATESVLTSTLTAETERIAKELVARLAESLRSRTW